MTHTLHRVGDRESLEKDYVVYALASNVEMLRGNEPLYENTRELLTRFMEICYRHEPVNAGCIYPDREPYSKTYAKGDTWEEMKAEMMDYTETLAAFDEKEKLRDLLRELKEADLRLSVVVSGIFDEVFECCRETGLTPHTVNMALGILGREELIPPRKVLDVVTMCGHGLVSRYLVEDFVVGVVEGRITADEAAQRLGANCVCGAFNTARAADIMAEMAAERKGSGDRGNEDRR